MTISLPRPDTLSPAALSALQARFGPQLDTTAAALESGFGPVIVVLAGMVTGCFGGLMRDVVGNEVPLILRKGELYLTAAFGGAVAEVTVLALGMPPPAALLTCGILTFTLRGGSLIWGWRLPVYRARPPRSR